MAGALARLAVWRSSVSRLALVYLLILVIAVSVVRFTSYLVSQREITRQADLIVQTELQAMREQYRFGGVQRLVEVLNRRVDDWGRLGAVYLFMDNAGNKLAGNLTGWPQEVRRDGTWLEFQLVAREGGDSVDHPVRASVIALGRNRLLVGTDMSEQERISRQQRSAMIWSIGLTAVFAALAGWWYSRRVASRIREVASACQDIMAGHLSHRLPAGGSQDEFDQLIAVVNRMLDRVDHQTAVMRTTFRSAAHDLRTPLQRARIRLEAGAAGEPSVEVRQAMVQSVADIDRVQRTLATLLQIAHAESGTVEERQWTPLDLAALVREMGELYQPAAAGRDIRIVVEAPQVAPMRGNRQLLAQLLANLLENALKFAPDGGLISLQARVADGRIVLDVADNGPGIPAERREEAVLPFRQLGGQEATKDAQGGSGLGLSLVAAVVHLHNGELQLRDNAPGLCAHCEFPALPPASVAPPAPAAEPEAAPAG
jgi:signal transduction histidine kinase